MQQHSCINTYVRKTNWVLKVLMFVGVLTLDVAFNDLPPFLLVLLHLQLFSAASSSSSSWSHSSTLRDRPLYFWRLLLLQGGAVAEEDEEAMTLDDGDADETNLLWRRTNSSRLIQSASEAPLPPPSCLRRAETRAELSASLSKLSSVQSERRSDLKELEEQM
jgi:hypothetical protein